MATFAITFRIKDDSTSQERWQSLVSAINDKNSEDIAWDETTSFALIKSSKSAAQLGDFLYYHSQILDSKDKLLLINLSESSDYYQRGVDYPSILSSYLSRT